MNIIRDKIKIQSSNSHELNYDSIVYFDIQTDFSPTKKILHKQSRFLYIISGSAKIKIQNEVHIMKKGALFALLPWQISEIIEVDDHISYYLLVYKFDFVNNVIKQNFNINNENFDIIKSMYDYNCAYVEDNMQDKIARLFKDIRDEVGIKNMNIDITPKKYSDIYILSRLTELIIYYIRMIQEENMSTPVISEEIFKYMYLNLSENITLENMSKIFFMSEASISKYIHSMTGLGFYDLLQEMKVSKAQFLLLHTNMTLEDIAKLLNFSDCSALSKIFSKNYGIGTKRFRQSNKKLNSIINARLDDRSVNIINYIYDNYEEDIDILDISKTFDISTRTINQILKYYVEETFDHFLNRVRLNKACELLINTDTPIVDIAIMTGFNSYRTFTRNFVKEYMMTPTEFRIGVREECE